MHSTTNEVIVSAERAKELNLPEGAHVLTTILEADGPFEMATARAGILAGIISTERTESGGVKIVSYFDINEPAPEPAPEAPAQPERMPTAEDLATEYLVKEKNMTAAQASDAVLRFGATKVLQRKNAQRDAELDSLLKTE